jgi:hypothetical protein
MPIISASLREGFRDYEFHYDTESGEFIVKNANTGTTMKPTRHRGKYWKYELTTEDERFRQKLKPRKQWQKHRLIATLFIDNPDPVNKTIVDHIDRDNQNNRLENLRWVSPRENCLNGKLFINQKGYKYMPKTGQWLVHLDRRHHGYFQTEEEAVAKVEEVKNELIATITPSVSNIMLLLGGH